MKKTITLLLTLFYAATPLLAKPYTQQGIAYLYDYKTKTKKPVANVRLTVVGAQPTISKDDGTFTLMFDSYSLGDKVSFEKQPYYQGMKVFNKKEVDNWFIVKDRLRLIMCRYEEFELAKNNFYQQGLRAATAKYEKEIARIKADQKLKEAEKNQKLQEAEEFLQQAMESLSEASEAMARIDQSENNVQMQKVLELYEKGDVNEAKKMLSNMQLVECLEQSLKDKAVNQAGLQKAIKDSAMAVQNIRSAIELHKNEYEWEQVIKYQKILADKLQTPHDLFQYAYYSSQYGGNPQELELYYEKVLETTKESKQWNTYHLYLYATTMNNMADIYEAKGLREKAEQAYKDGIEGRRKYAHLTKNPNDENHIAWSLVSLSRFYICHKQYQDAERVLNEAEVIYQRIKPLIYKDSEWTYGRLFDTKGWLFHETGQLDKAENNYIEAFKLYGKCVHQDPKSHLTSMRNICHGGLCAIYDSQKRPFESEKYQKELVDLYRKWIPQYPHALKEEYEIVLSELADLYYNAQRFTEMEEMYKQALDIYQLLEKENPKAYELDVALMLNNLANLYYETKQFTEAEDMYKQALEIYQRLTKDDPNAYEPYVAMTLYNLANLYYKTKQFTEAEDMNKKALEIYQRLAKDDSNAYEPYVATTMNSLAVLYYYAQRFTETEEMYKQTLEIYQRLANDNPKIYEPNVAQTLGNLSFNAIFMKKYSEAEQLAREGWAVDSTQHWIASNLAAALLLHGRYTEAEPIYRQYKGELKDSFLDDFKQFKAYGVIPKEREEDVEKIKRMLEE